MAVHLDYDTDKRIIYVITAPTAGVLSLDVQVDIYSDMKEDWKTDTTLNKFKFPLAGPVGGNVIVPGSKNVSPYYFLKYGWLMRPYEADHTLYLENAYLLVDGGWDPWLKTLGGFTVNIRDSIPADAFALVSGSGVTEQDKLDIADRVWDEVTADHVNTNQFGGSVATKTDLDALTTTKIYTVTGAGDITVNLGAIESGDYTNVQAHDETYLEVSETTTGFDVVFTIPVAADDIPRTFQFYGRYQGSANHEVHVQAYNHETSSFEILVPVSGADDLESSLTDYFREFILTSNHVNPSTNEVLIKIVQGAPGIITHRLWVDKVAVVTALTVPTVTEEGVAAAVWDELMSDHELAGTFGLVLADIIKLTGFDVTKDGDIITIWDGSMIWRKYNLANGQRIQV